MTTADHLTEQQRRIAEVHRIMQERAQRIAEWSGPDSECNLPQFKVRQQEFKE
jgi:hypothetical protein